jgi:hypothetical protein
MNEEQIVEFFEKLSDKLWSSSNAGLRSQRLTRSKFNKLLSLSVQAMPASTHRSALVSALPQHLDALYARRPTSKRERVDASSESLSAPSSTLKKRQRRVDVGAQDLFNLLLIERRQERNAEQQDGDDDNNDDDEVNDGEQSSSSSDGGQVIDDDHDEQQYVSAIEQCEARGKSLAERLLMKESLALAPAALSGVDDDRVRCERTLTDCVVAMALERSDRRKSASLSQHVDALEALSRWSSTLDARRCSSDAAFAVFGRRLADAARPRRGAAADDTPRQLARALRAANAMCGASTALFAAADIGEPRRADADHADALKTFLTAYARIAVSLDDVDVGKAARIVRRAALTSTRHADVLAHIVANVGTDAQQHALVVELQ